MRKWQLQEAKARLSEVIRKAEEGPQEITLHGQPAAVVISSEDYRKLKAQNENFIQFMRRSPLFGMKIDLKREQTLTRTTEIA